VYIPIDALDRYYDGLHYIFLDQMSDKLQLVVRGDKLKFVGHSKHS
jgi:hypothetical protein